MTVARKTNYLSNVRLVEEIKAAQVKFKKRMRESNSGDVQPSECMSRELLDMMILLVDKTAQNSRWRRYSYLSDMKSEAYMSMIQHGLKFNSDKFENAFGYYTQIIWHTFMTFTEKERKQRKIKDRIIETTPDIQFETSHGHQEAQERNQLNRDLDGTQRIKADPIRMRRAVAQRRKNIDRESIPTVDSGPVEDISSGE